MGRGTALCVRAAALLLLAGALVRTTRAMHDTFFGSSVASAVVILESPVSHHKQHHKQIFRGATIVTSVAT